jgi:hypothetical protein
MTNFFAVLAVLTRVFWLVNIMIIGLHKTIWGMTAILSVLRSGPCYDYSMANTCGCMVAPDCWSRTQRFSLHS